MLSQAVNAQQRTAIDTLNIFSTSMNKNIKVVLIKPDGYKKIKSGLNVVYLLHGYAGAYNSWAIKMPGIQKLATEFKNVTYNHVLREYNKLADAKANQLMDENR